MHGVVIRNTLGLSRQVLTASNDKENNLNAIGRCNESANILSQQYAGSQALLINNSSQSMLSTSNEHPLLSARNRLFEVGHNDDETISNLSQANPMGSPKIIYNKRDTSSTIEQVDDKLSNNYLSKIAASSMKLAKKIGEPVVSCTGGRQIDIDSSVNDDEVNQHHRRLSVKSEVLPLPNYLTASLNFDPDDIPVINRCHAVALNPHVQKNV
jgi:hypothetical protein